MISNLFPSVLPAGTVSTLPQKMMRRFSLAVEANGWYVLHFTTTMT
jgi:hypothetical protein